MQLIASSFTPHPRLYLEYVPCGSLEDHEDISYNETLTILSQCLSALAYLHGRETPIAHRDIKPANILVQYRFDGDISVKLGDFGLSRDRAELMTLCGTQTYLAPEIHSELQHYVGNETGLGYTAVVDIWSLGVVACELACGLPRYKDQYRNDGVAWCKSIITRLQKTLQKNPNDLGQFLLNTMVVLSPESRFSADDCYDLVVRLPRTEIDSLLAWTPASYPEEEDQATLRYIVQNDGVEDLATVVFQPRSHTETTTSYFVKSGAPPPSSRMTQQHGEPEVPSSSAIRWYGNLPEGHEMSHFWDDYSTDSFNSLYVGSSLASQFGDKSEGNFSEDWANQFLQESSQSNQAGAAGSQAGMSSGTTRLSIPRGERGGWYLPSGTRQVEGGDTIGADDYEETAGVALLLQAIGQSSRAS